MDIRGLRTLNLAGTVIFGIFGIVVPIIYLVLFGVIFWLSPGESYFVFCSTALIIWIAFIGMFTYYLYINAVLGLDRGDFETAKRWTLYGMIVGFVFAGGLITLIIFLISYISFDEAVWPKPYYYPPPYYPYPPPYPYGPSYPQAPPYPQATHYPAQQPKQVNVCPNCRQILRYVPEKYKWYCSSCGVYFKKQ